MLFTLVLNSRSLCCAFNNSEDSAHLLKSVMLLITRQLTCCKLQGKLHNSS